MKKFFVRTTENEILNFKTEKEAVECIEAMFADNGQNPVEEVWAEEDGKTIDLACSWTVKLEEVE
jgi:hypothetical protein